MTEELLLSIEDGVAIIIFNRPERLNALTRGMLSGLRMETFVFVKGTGSSLA